MDIYSILLLAVTFLLLVLADGCFLTMVVSPIESEKSKILNSIIWVGFSHPFQIDPPSFHLSTIHSANTDRPSVRIYRKRKNRER